MHATGVVIFGRVHKGLSTGNITDEIVNEYLEHHRRKDSDDNSNDGNPISTIGHMEVGYAFSSAEFIKTKLLSKNMPRSTLMTLQQAMNYTLQVPKEGWTVEMQLKAAKAGLRCTEVPVRYRQRIGVSKVSGTVKGTIMAGYKIIWTIIKYL